MPEIIRDCIQGDEAWHLLRLGSVGGSSIPAILAKGKGGEGSKMREKLLRTLVKQIVTGKREKTYYNESMQMGHIFEPKSRFLYEWRHGVDVEQVAMIKSNMPRVHVSPDGLVAPDGSIEIKCMEFWPYLDFLKTKKINPYHVNQCQHIFVVSGDIRWCDYIVYCPELDETNEGVEIKEKYRGTDPIWVKRLYRDEEMIKLIETELVKFLKELDELLERINK